MGFRNMHPRQVGLVINLLNGSISPQYHVIFVNMFSDVVTSTPKDLEVWIRLETSITSRIQFMLNKENDP